MKTFDRLIALARRLRSVTGCPWDRKQTLASLAVYLTEEVEEARTAMRQRDHENLAEELGDLLFNIVMMTQIASEKKFFRMTDVLRGVERKMRARHSWVFGEDRKKVKTANDALRLWRQNKIKLRKKNCTKIKKC